MLNPYTLLTPQILAALLRQPMYFVRQEYKRGIFVMDSEKTTSLLLTHYARHETDEQPPGFRVYINLMPKEWKASDELKRKISSYMLYKLPWWQYSPADKLKVTLKERYGELYLALLWKGQQTEVHLDEIEKFIPCATT